MKIQYLKTEWLSPHPSNQEIYGDTSNLDSDFLNSIKKQGLLEAIQATPDNVIISGHRRWNAAKQLGMHEVPVMVRDNLTDELEVRELVVVFNKNREKDQEQKIREFNALAAIEAERARGRQLSTQNNDAGRAVKENFPEQHSGQSRDIAAGKIGMSGKAAEMGSKVVAVMDGIKLVDPVKASEIKETLEKSVSKAFTMVKPILEEKKKMSDTVKNAKYEVEQVSETLFIQKSTNENYSPSFNPTNENIEWAKWSWNPVTGCLFGCPYCYARAMAENEYYGDTFLTKFKPTFHPGRLSAPKNHTIPSARKDEPGINNVFLCSMADLWGDWIPTEWIQQILTVIEQHPEYNFISLTKNPKRYLDFEFPENIWLGATADTQKRFDVAMDVFKEMGEDYGNVKFLSCEPLIEQIFYETHTNRHLWHDFETGPDIDNCIAMHGYIDWVIIGGLKGSENTDRQPEWEWVEALIRFARDSNAAVYFKTNLTVTPKEIPVNK